MAHFYKNKSDQPLTVPGAGYWEAGETKESPIEINNPNFEKVAAATTPQAQPVAPAAQTNQTQAKEGDK